MHVPHPVYKALGIEKLVKLSEGVLGELNEKSRKDVEAGYVMATGFLIAGDVTGNPFCIAADLCIRLVLFKFKIILPI